MAELTHGTDLSLSPTLGPLVRLLGGTVRSALDRFAALGFESIQLDATLKGIRSRELSHSGRRDLHALVRRRGARPAGLDCFIPPKHYTSTEHGERALTATREAIELAADLGHLPVSLTLPVDELPEAVSRAIVEAADGYDVPLAVHGETEPEALSHWLEQIDLPTVGAGLDPAAALAAGADPAQAAQQLGPRLMVARLSDWEPSPSGGRCAVGQGRLDLAAYRVSVDLAERRKGPIALELRGLNAPLAAAQQAGQRWADAAFRL
jgi:sugar phosphate isomerase/epimerase